LKKRKILFIHNKAMWYRIPLFNTLAGDMDVKFIFTNENKVEGLRRKYKILRRYGCHSFNVALGLVLRLIREEYDVVVFPPTGSPGEIIDNFFCFVIAKLVRKPYIIWSERWICKKVKRSLVRRVYRSIDQAFMSCICRYAGACVTSGGTKQKDYFTSLGIPENRIFIVPYLSDIAAKNFDFQHLEEKKKKIEEGLKVKNKKIILCVARLIERKGIHYLIKAFAKLKREIEGVSLVIVGGKDYYGSEKFYGDKLKRLCLDLNVSKDVLFVGHIKSDDLPSYYLLCNFLVFPSIADTFADTGGLPISDAMYFSKPVISTDVVGFAYDLVKDGLNGFMVPEKDTDALYQAMKMIVTNPDLEKKMGVESKRMIEEKFAFGEMVKRFEEAIEYASKGLGGSCLFD